MARITVEDCLSVVDNRFELVLMASKRARQLAKGVEPALDNSENQDKPTVLALREIAARKVDSAMIEEVEKLERERRVAAFGDKATDAVRDLDMLERIFGALGDILIFDQTVHQFAPVAIRHLDRSQAANYTEQGFPQLIDLVRGMLVDIDHIGSAPRDHLHETDPRKAINDLLAYSCAVALDPSARGALLAFAWPGNVRQLRTVLRTLVALCDEGRVGLEDLPAQIRQDRPVAVAQTKPLESPLEDAERLALLTALQQQLKHHVLT